GFGMAAKLGISFPTGDVDAFTGDGAVDYEVGLIADYRFKSGFLLAANAGLWFRPERVFVSSLLGPMLPLGAAVEVPVVRRWGLFVLGEVYGNISLTKLIEEPRQT